MWTLFFQTKKYIRLSSHHLLKRVRRGRFEIPSFSPKPESFRHHHRHHHLPHSQQAPRRPLLVSSTLASTMVRKRLGLSSKAKTLFPTDIMSGRPGDVKSKRRSL
ncbi:hypothetical protein EJ05DRAFT_9905 [Pseudovirgaria hyperparasitica]|uniref:Uncharacterized protein n=1 Tax=Pseudovirgaria hyperparasitica TaxID=470096 RepID=A0A6A6WKK6_9PEZI|nr:uncharacterized protein EJ05DRAFT_9905 [Pseudovirgaria hyperparasitica]KAF2762696.1 hypothetical protein EJ05DRAFT_9905 [Pseudovirgaria hyperparasitica]